MLTFHRCGTEVTSSILNTKGTGNTSDGPASHVKTHPTVRSSTGAQSPQHMPQTSPIAWPAMTYDPTDLAYARNRCFVSTTNHHIRSIRELRVIHTPITKLNASGHKSHPTSATTYALSLPILIITMHPLLPTLLQCVFIREMNRGGERRGRVKLVHVHSTVHAQRVGVA
jgi:hypothetical protein